MNNICFITSSLVGPTLNGGVGTAMYYQACLLQKKGFNVSILFTGNYQVGNKDVWKKKFASMDIEYYSLDSEIQEYKINIKDSNWWVWRSYYVMKWLEDKDFDILHFAETCGYAYHTLQAKRTTDKFKDVKIVVTMHSPTEWIYEGNQIWPFEVGEKDRKTKLFLKLNYAERYVCENADYLLAPSITMFEWALKKGWKLAEKRKVLFNPYIGKREVAFSNIDENHFIFFGTLDKRKGLDVFCQAIRKYVEKNPDSDLKVSFLGRSSKIDNLKSEEFINKNLAGLPINIQIYTNFDTYRANEYIKKTGGIAVLCSRQDNSPYSIVECIENKIPFICSNVGGMPELVDERVLFSMDKMSLYHKFEDIHNIHWENLNHKYSALDANEAICEINFQILNEKDNAYIEHCEHEDKRITVCIAYYNHGRYLETLLTNLEENTYSNTEIIIMDDGSDEESSVEAFDYFKKLYQNKNGNIKFLRKNRTSKGDTYNECAKIASGDYLLFMNAEQMIMSNTLSIMKYAIEKAKLDIVTCHAKMIKGLGLPNIMNLELEIDVPIGASLENGLLDNELVKNVFMIKKHIYDSVGGMRDSDEISLEQCLVISSMLQGYKFDVVPELLCWQRVFSNENSLSYKKYLGFNAYEELLDTFFSNSMYMKHFMKNWCLPRYVNLPIEKNEVYSENISLNKNDSNAENIILRAENKDLLSMLSTVRAELLENNKEKINLLEEKKFYESRIKDLNIALNNIENARFWKMTKPLRVICQMVKDRLK